MQEFERDRNICFSILNEYTKSESLIKHALAVETCVRAYAIDLNEDEKYWGNVALLHDFDYEKYPTAEEHPYKGNEILKERGFSDEFRNAIMSHADYTGVKRTSKLEKVLFACDELAGFITAVTCVRPSRTVDEVEVKSVMKKMKDKAFARTVSTEDIIKGAEAGLGLLQKHGLVDPKRIAAICYCFGGTTVIELARSGADIACVVSFHGGLDSPNPEDGKNIKCKVLALHGADDPFVPAKDLAAFEEEMRQAKVDWQLVKYGGAVHSFTEKHAGDNNLAGAAYNERADRRSWADMRQFFSETLR